LEYVFLIVVVFSVVLYLSDPKGWNATAKRLTTIARANLEAKKPIKELEPIKDKDQWEQEFKEIENPQPLVPVAAPKKHAIVKRGYKQAHTGLWPEWVCKCGTRGSTPSGIWSDEETHGKAKKEGDTHVYTANLADERLENSKGKDFAW
jgi:hypothetical protein